MKRLWRFLMLVGVMALAFSGGVWAQEEDGQDDGLFDLSLEDLLSVEVTSVAKRAQPLHDAAAAIFVLNQRDIRRSGASSLPEALRLVPGLHVARIDANKWAISARGFNNRFGGKLLVLVDGRTVYNTAFTGVFWELPNLLLEDIDRIEVIRGPGSALWGANAVNGVINVVTSNAADAQGALVVAEGGTLESGRVGLRYGTQFGPATFAKFYGSGRFQGAFELADGTDANGSYDIFRAGMQINSQNRESEDLTFQAEAYEGRGNQLLGMTVGDESQLSDNPEDEIDMSGAHVLARWSRSPSPTSELFLQAYYDYSNRREFFADLTTQIFDYEFQHQFGAGERRFTWGLGYRHVFIEAIQVRLPFSGGEHDANNVFSAFAQDEMPLVSEKLDLILGSKFEHNDYTGFEVQPTARLLWRPGREHRVWTAVSRAVRTPAMIEDHVELAAAAIMPGTSQNPSPYTLLLMLQGNADYDSEELLAYELGYRFTRPSFTLDLSLFYNDYKSLQTAGFGEPEVRFWEDPIFIAQPVVLGNEGEGARYGAELVVSWQASDLLRLDMAYTRTEDDEEESELDDPHTQQPPRDIATAGVSLTPADRMNLGATLRHVGEILPRGLGTAEQRMVPGYTTLDLRLGWSVTPDIQFVLVGHNLLEENHLEFRAESYFPPVMIPRSVSAKVQVSF